MATRKKAESGIAAIVAKQDPVSIQELTMQDFFAAFALQGLLAYYGDKSHIPDVDGDPYSLHRSAYTHADEMLSARAAS
jgi:hypothetical protein